MSMQAWDQKNVALPISCVLSHPSPIYKVRPRTVKDEDDAEGGAQWQISWSGWLRERNEKDC